MTRKEVMSAIDDLLEEAGITTLENDMELIRKEIEQLDHYGYSTIEHKPFNKISVPIEKEIRDAKFNALLELMKEKKRKLELDMHIEPKFIQYLEDEPNIKYPETVKALTITYLNMQNGADEKKTMTIIKGSLANIFINLHSMSKRKAGEEATSLTDKIFPYFVTNFNAKRIGRNTAVYTDFGYILKLP